MEERKLDFKEVERILSDAELREQTSRCMNCGQPFCHAYACPLGNLVPDQNRAVSQGDWKRAYALLSANSDFPEFTSRRRRALPSCPTRRATSFASATARTARR